MSGQGPRVVVLLRRLGAAAECLELLGGCERAALAAAVHVRDALRGTLTAMALGPLERELPVLRAALAAGCDRALCVAPDTGATASAGDTGDAAGIAVAARDRHGALDYLSAAEILAAAVRRTGCDVLLCGDRSQETRQGALGPAVAERLGMAHLTGVVAVRIDAGAGAILAEHRGNGHKHRFRCALPVALCVLTHSPMAAALDPEAVDATRVERVTISELGAEHGGATSAMREPGSAVRGPGDAGAAGAAGRQPAAVVSSAAELVARLVEDHVLR